MAVPAGAEVVEAWLSAVLVDRDLTKAWKLMDEPLRVALIQGCLMRQFPEHTGDDQLASELAGAGPAHEMIPTFSTELDHHWTQSYSDLADGYGYLDVEEPLAPDLELVVVTPIKTVRRIRANEPILGHCFIVRLNSDAWSIAATARRLPVPGWPPSEQALRD